MPARIFLRLAQWSSANQDLETIKSTVKALTDTAPVSTTEVMGTVVNLKRDGSKGDFHGLIECWHYEHQLGQNAVNFPTAGISAHNTFYLNKDVDVSSAALANYCHYSLPLPYAIVYIVLDTNPRVKLFQYTLIGVNIARLRHSDSHAADTYFSAAGSTGVLTAQNVDGAVPRESLQLAYRFVEWRAFTPPASGTQKVLSASVDRLFGPNTTASPPTKATNNSGVWDGT